MLSTKILIKSSIWLGLGSIVHELFIFALIIIMARFGRASELGIFYTILHVLFNTTSSANTLLNTIYMKHLRRFAAKKRLEDFTNWISASLSTTIIYSIFTMIVFVTMTRLLFSTSQSQNWQAYIIPLSLAVPFQILSSRISGSLLLLGKFKEVVFLQRILSSLLRVGLMVIFVIVFNLGLYGAIISQSIAIILYGLVAILMVKILLPNFRFKLNKVEVPSRTGLAIASSSALIKSMDLFMVAILFGFRSLGHYISVLFLPSLIYLISTSFFSMFYQVAAIQKKKGKDIAQAARLVTKWLTIVVVILAFFVTHFADEIVLNLLGHKYDISVEVVVLLSFAFSFSAVSSIANNVLFAFKHFLAGALINVVSASSFIIIALFTFKNGILGIAQALLISSILEFVLRFIIQYYKTKIMLFDRDLAKVAIGAILSISISLYFIPSSIASYLLFLLIFTSFLIVTKTLRKKGLFHQL